MKYKIPILSALLALMLAACSSDNAGDIITPSDTSHDVSIVLTPEKISGDGTRATVEGDDQYNENLITSVNLYFFTGSDEPANDAKIACTKERIVPATYSQQGTGEHSTTLQFKLSDSELSDIFGAGTSCRVLVLANYDNSLSATTYSELKNSKLTSFEFANNDRVDGLVMTGEGVLTKDGDNISGSSIPMYRHAAKINIRFEDVESNTWKINNVEAKITNLNEVTTLDRTAIPDISDANVSLFNSLWHGIPEMKTTVSVGGGKTYNLIPIYSYPIVWLGKEESGPQVIAIAKWQRTITTGEGENESTTTEDRIVSYQFPLVIQTGSTMETQTVNKLTSNTSYIVNIPLKVPTD